MKWSRAAQQRLGAKGGCGKTLTRVRTERVEKNRKVEADIAY